MAGRRGRKGNGEGNIRQRSDERWEEASDTILHIPQWVVTNFVHS